jgi:hypothetical protein
VRNPALGKFKRLRSSSAAFGGDPKDDFSLNYNLDRDQGGVEWSDHLSRPAAVRTARRQPASLTEAVNAYQPSNSLASA